MTNHSGPILTCGVTPEHHGERLDRFLAGALFAENISRTRVKSLIQEGHASIDGATVTDPSLLLRAGQTALLRLPPPLDPAPKAENLGLAIVFEDHHLLIIDKPAGLVVHPSGGHEAGTLVNGLIGHCGDELSGIGGVRRPGIVHRLDKDTSGLLVVAKTDAAHQGLARLFADHGKTLPLIREYLAFAWGVPDRPFGTIDAPLARDGATRQKIAIAPAGRGRRAVTHWRLQETFHRQVSMIACQLETGRTHQIRVHLAHIRHPVLGDPLYARGYKAKAAKLPAAAEAAVAALSRQALHAAVLGFPHPLTGKILRFESPLPEELSRLHDALRRGIGLNDVSDAS
ncbi:MAG TPA: RluA family pseudouridine synthase [Methylocella sp.]|nr:RluA family pseudouridine synthase [Methylocella sp.]